MIYSYGGVSRGNTTSSTSKLCLMVQTLQIYSNLIRSASFLKTFKTDRELQFKCSAFNKSECVDGLSTLKAWSKCQCYWGKPAPGLHRVWGTPLFTSPQMPAPKTGQALPPPPLPLLFYRRPRSPRLPPSHTELLLLTFQSFHNFTRKQTDTTFIWSKLTEFPLITRYLLRVHPQVINAKRPSSSRSRDFWVLHKDRFVETESLTHWCAHNYILIILDEIKQRKTLPKQLPITYNLQTHHYDEPLWIMHPNIAITGALTKKKVPC